MEVLPSPQGSQAIPRRGAMALLNSLPTLLPKGDFMPVCPANVGGAAKIRPLSGLKLAGLHWLVDGTPLTRETSIFPFARIQGACAGSQNAGSKLTKRLLPPGPLASVGWRKKECRMP